MMNDQLKDADSKAAKNARLAREAEQRRKEEERRRKAEEERRRKEMERKAEEDRRRREEEERKRREEEERKRRQQEAEEKAKQAALEAAQSGWQPPQVQNQEQARPGTLADAAAKLDGLIEGIRNSAQAGTKPPASQLEQWQPNTIRKISEEAMEKQQPKEAETRMAGQLMAGKAKAQAGPYTRTLMDNVLAHEGDTDDPFLMELNRDSWEQEYRDGRTKALRGAVERLADDLLAGRAKPEEAVPARDGETTVTSGDLADPFLQGLFGEQELKDEFVKGQMKQFEPALEKRIAQLRDKVSGQTEEERQKDTAYGTNMVYNTNKNGIQQADGGIKTLSGAYKDNEGQSLIQPMSAQVSGPQQGNAEDKPSTEAAQFGWQPPQEETGGSALDLGMGPITQEKADEVRAAGAQTLTPEETGIRDWLEAHPDETINGVNAAMLDDFEQQMAEAQNSGPRWTTSNAVQWNKACCSAVPGATLSDNGKALIVDGRSYPVNPSWPVSNSEQVIDVPWETVGSYTQTNVSFDAAKGFAKMSLEGMDGGSGTDLGNGNVYQPKGSKASAGAETVLNALGFALNSVSSVDYTVTLLEQNKGTTNEKTQAIVEVGTSEDRRKKANLEPGREYSLINDKAGDEITRNQLIDLAKNSYEAYSGEPVDPRKQYDVVCTFDKEYLDNPTIGRLEQDKDGNVVCKPYLTGVKIEIIEYGGGKITKRIPLTDGTGRVFFSQRDSIPLDQIS